MWLEALVWILRVALVLVCLLMVLVILMQRSKQEGLGAAFGAGMTESVFGADTSNVLSKTTVWCAVLFFSITLTLSAISARRIAAGGGGSRLQQAAQEAAQNLTPPPAPASTNAAPNATNAPAAPTPAPAATNAPAPAAAK